MIKEGVLFDELADKKVKCHVCSHRCTITEGKVGICRTRQNRNGKIYTLIYNVVSSEAVDPVEKKPLYHFLPGTLSYSLGSIGCNFRCEHCQNWNISQVNPEESYTMEITPEAAINRALAYGSKSISWTYNEPAIWHEYTFDSAVLAKKAGLKTVYVTNGYITPEALRRMAPYLDAYRVDIKSFSEDFYRKTCGARLAPVLESTKLAKELGMHVETVTLIIPTKNDSSEEITQIVRWVHDNLGMDTPMHFTRFHPMYKMNGINPTPLDTLEMAYNIAKKVGMRFVYLGNVGGHKYENTYCPKCNALLIDRLGFRVGTVKIKDGKCPECGEMIPIVV
ncbi:MAG: pyruvate formate-lyase activating protein-like protein [Candidatus Methanoperedens nitroreducens]|uniref:Pyruvate formate-lyase activating protein-like protein n=1 Tax=Candidatus Methanoperedens nitratireducens TaxID=1392998 RepID=A0A0N8KQ99_9EURY|nr:AmmeMemoRadiSam system radical SAM enzyme [Candidatus Methanoperedens sp. BLZ2]KAB2947732.1 MAG: AmmeMemoRadiSam system radical SAM enzyme [Candidatus Methanoperedens sp.]KPQ41546.1 MAG: pyruvate formate-lyase activating protein-like protein [Candidatus Methanoperedens sp. BLZ1]MBZ0176203.1 AmmeMemoRadiSam system radical SAM enzyme [Candidatus Methanoperedens nitroreducens]CAG1001298.1 Pyruvate formate-lyase 1-activating enzyme [Methanosarcinales archaeon]MCX9077430.1 AmmeMemoRadiSam system